MEKVNLMDMSQKEQVKIVTDLYRNNLVKIYPAANLFLNPHLQMCIGRCVRAGLETNWLWISLFSEVGRLRGLAFHKKAFLLRELVTPDDNGTPLAIHIMEGKYDSWETPRITNPMSFDRLDGGQDPEDWIVGVSGSPGNRTIAAQRYTHHMLRSKNGNIALSWLYWRLKWIKDPMSHSVINSNLMLYDVAKDVLLMKEPTGWVKSVRDEIDPLVIRPHFSYVTGE